MDNSMQSSTSSSSSDEDQEPRRDIFQTFALLEDLLEDNNLLSENSSSDDEESPCQMPRVLLPRNQPFSDYDDVRLKRRFRLTKDTVSYIFHMIKDQLEAKSLRNCPVSAINQLLIALRFYATGNFQICTGDHFNVSAPTVCRIIKKVTIVIAKLRCQFIKLPTSQNEVRKVRNNFYRIGNVPNVLGAIDCTHVKIQSPGGNYAEVFRNRKGWFSINVQAVCDADLKFMDVVSRWPGSTHDATIFDDSTLRARLENEEFPNLYLLGDGGYPCRTYLLTPIHNPSNVAESAYNVAHIKTRNPIERAFGVLKRRFPCLSVGMRLKIETVVVVIVVCMMLHNIAIHSNDLEPDVEEIEVPVLENPEHEISNRRGNNTVRTALINTMFNR